MVAHNFAGSTGAHVPGDLAKSTDLEGNDNGCTSNCDKFFPVATHGHMC